MGKLFTKNERPHTDQVFKICNQNRYVKEKFIDTQYRQMLNSKIINNQKYVIHLNERFIFPQRSISNGETRAMSYI